MKAGKRRRDERGEHWTKLIRTTMEEPAWRALSTTAQALYPWLKLEWRGPDANNNGKIRLSVRQAAQRVGVSHVTAAKAFHDLQRKGFIVQAEPGALGVEGAAKAPAYELTELGLPGGDGGGRKIYRDWRPNRELPVAETSSNNPQGRNGRKTKPRHRNDDATVIETMTKAASLS